MKKPFIGIGLSDMLANLSISSFATYAKTLFVMLCLQLVCLGVSASSISKIEQTANYVKFSYSASGSASLRVIKNADISKYYGKAENCPYYYSCSLSSSGTITVPTTSLDQAVYLAAIIENGKTGPMCGFEVPYVEPVVTPVEKVYPEISAKQNMDIVNVSYKLPSDYSYATLKIYNNVDVSANSGNFSKCPEKYSQTISQSQNSLSLNWCTWSKGTYVFVVYYNSKIIATTSLTFTPVVNEITSASFNYSTNLLTVNYTVKNNASKPYLSVSSSSVATKNITAGTKGNTTFDLKSLTTGQYSVRLFVGNKIVSTKSFSIFRSSLTANNDDDLCNLTVNYTLSGSTNSAYVRLFPFSEVYSKGVLNATPVYNKPVYSYYTGKMVIPTDDYCASPGQYVVAIIENGKVGSSITVNLRPNPAPKLIVTNTNSSLVYFKYKAPRNSTNNCLKIWKQEDFSGFGSEPFKTINVGEFGTENYCYRQDDGGVYNVYLFSGDGKIQASGSYNVDRIRDLRYSNNVISIDYKVTSTSGYDFVVIYVSKSGQSYTSDYKKLDSNAKTGTFDFELPQNSNFGNGEYIVHMRYKNQIVGCQSIWITR